MTKLIKPLGEQEQAVVALLENALKAAKNGDFTSLAIVYCKQGGYGCTFCGAQAAELYLATASLQKQVLEATEGASGAPRRAPTILHAVPAG